MIPMFLFFGALTIALYALYSRRVGSTVNAISIFTGLKLVIEFVLEPLGYLLNLFDYRFSAMLMVYSLSFCAYAAFIAGLMLVEHRPPPVRRITLPNYLFVAWILLIAAWAVYVPILIEFRQFLTDPRQIYEQTRVGYGFSTYGSALLTFCAYIVYLMSSKKGRIPFYAALLLLITLKGAKGQFFVLIGILVIAKVYLEGFRYSITRSAIYGSLAAVGTLYLFAFTYRGEIGNIFVTIAGYSDYNRNAALVVQDGTFGGYGGQITAESLWIPKVPRAFWPEKPLMFGEFRLAAQYYPEWFALQTGSPSFGFGTYLADFGWFSFPIVAMIYLVSGYLLGIVLSGMSRTPNAFNFVMSCYLSGNNLLLIGTGMYLFEHAIVGWVIFFILSLVRSTATVSAIDHRSGALFGGDSARPLVARPSVTFARDSR